MIYFKLDSKPFHSENHIKTYSVVWIKNYVMCEIVPFSVMPAIAPITIIDLHQE